MQEKPNLDVLRSIAVVLVVLDHILLAQDIQRFRVFGMVWGSGWMGAFGVYLFFLHTSLVLMWSLERKPDTLNFYVRRIFRIYPLAVLAIIAVVLFHLPFSSDHDHFFVPYHATFAGVMENLFLIQNIGRGGGYVLQVLWSLPLEVDMYVLLPAVYFYVKQNFRLWPLLLIWALACGLAFHEAFGVTTFLTVVPLFLPGVMAFVLFAKVTPRIRGVFFPVLLIAALVLFMRFQNIVAAWPICLLLGLSMAYFLQIRSKYVRRAAHEVAKYSYGVYLSHVIALGICFKLLHFAHPGEAIALALALTAAFSFAGYHLVEAPMIRFGAHLAARISQPRILPA